MQTKNLIAVNEFCINHKIEIAFISSLQETGLIEIAFIKDSAFINAEQLPQVEKYIHFYYDLDINLEGIETITHLLHRINAMNDEIATLRNKLRLYE
jgi:hypothetical protein